MTIRKRLLQLTVFGGLGLSFCLTGTNAVAGEETPYEVQCENNKCEVDKQTYIGWRTYHASCYQCHAQNAVGSTFAPSLVKRLQSIDKDRFMDVVKNGYEGQIGKMPAWKNDPNVSPRFEAIYSYLKARADGVLPGGKPGRLN